MDTQRQQQVVALGRLGWPLRRIERETGVLRETASEYLKAADVPVRGRGRPGEGRAKPAIAAEVSTDSCPRACAPHRERVVAALALGRNAMAVWQDLVDQVKAAERLGISLNRLNEIVLGKRGITADTALRLSRLLKTSPQLWMRLQADWDLHQALQREGRKAS